MKYMSFAMTADQIKARTKRVTRRVGWESLKVGQMLWACRKSQGLRRGEQVEKFCVIIVESKRREPVDAITAEDCELEGFPGMLPGVFVANFCELGQCAPSTIITRIGFGYVDEKALPEPDKTVLELAMNLQMTYGDISLSEIARRAEMPISSAHHAKMRLIQLDLWPGQFKATTPPPDEIQAIEARKIQARIDRKEAIADGKLRRNKTKYQ